MLLDPIETEKMFCSFCYEEMDETGLCPNDCGENGNDEEYSEQLEAEETEAEKDLFDDDLEDVIPGFDYFYDVPSDLD